MIKYDDAAKRCNFVWNATNYFKGNGYPVSAVLMDKIIADNMDDEWQEYDYDPNDFSLDTCVADRVANLISFHFFGHPWPTYAMDEEARDRFHGNLMKELEKYE